MPLTRRDVEILKFINDFGFCEIAHISKKFNLRKPRNYKVMKRLVKAGLVIHQKFFYNNFGIYYLSNKGAQHTELPGIKLISPSTYHHQLTIIEVHIKLMQLFPNAIWISERYLKRDKFMEGIGKHGHVADAIMIFPNQIQVAIEIELTTKGQYRLQKILEGYASQVGINEVWYFCTNQSFNKITKLAADLKYVKVYSLQQFLDGNSL